MDAQGNAYVAGETNSPDFPTTKGALQLASFLCNAVITKFDTFGDLLYASVIGGKGDDRAFAIDVDAQGNAYMAEETNSPDFPLTTGARAAMVACNASLPRTNPGA